MPSIRYIRWSLSLDMLDAIPAGTRSVHPSGLAGPGETLVGQRRARVQRGEEQGTMLQVEVRAARGEQIQGGCCHGAGHPDRPSWQHYSRQYTSLHARRRGIRFQMSSSRRHDQTSSHLQVTKAVATWPGEAGQCDRSANARRSASAELESPHQHRQCRGKMRAQIESEA